MKASEIRRKYIDFFIKKGHSEIPSSSLVPEHDSTLLFTNSGMFPLVPYLLGEKHPGGKRLANSQKCFRAEDIEEVGDHRHNTFFEMLGNWSLGDYFKQEQLTWWFEFLIDTLSIDINRIYQTVYAGDGKRIEKDNESIEIIKEVYARYGITAQEGPETLGRGEDGPGVELDFSKQRIFAYRDKNWWKRGDAVGELGGPDSETFYDTGKPHDPAFGPHCHLNCDCGRFIEIGNSVFMQYQKTKDGWDPLKNKNVDFGGGLERIAMIVQGKYNIFATDLFAPIIEKLEQISGKKYDNYPKQFEIIADHLKSATFLMADDTGLTPSNLDQGYIIRRLIRRAIRCGRQLEIKENLWTKDIAQAVKNIYAATYPELTKNIGFVTDQLDKEEARFAKTLDRGLREFEKLTANLSDKQISGANAFHLYDTYGFPVEMTEELAAEKSLAVNKQEFQQAYEQHQAKSRAGAEKKFTGGLADHSEQTTKYHTATHLLLAALRKVLGDHVYQKGSNITDERLRFDFSHPEKMTPEQIKQAEDLVNGEIQKGTPVVCEEMTVKQAKDQGAMGIFEDKYGNQVKVYSIGDFSTEICGGPHTDSLKNLGHFHIVKEEASSAGVRRIKAVLE